MAVTLFIVVDAALVGWALTATDDTPSSTHYIQPTSRPQPSTTPTPSPPPVVALPVRRSLAVAGESTIWRAEGGSCAAGTAPQLQTSTDAGATWTDRDLERYDVRQVLALSVRDVNFGTAAVKVGDFCELAGFRSFTGGQFWERADEVLADFTFLDPDDVSAVIVAGVRVPSPCSDAVQVAVSGGQPAALCAQSLSFVWADGSWLPLPDQAGAVAIVADASTSEFVFLGDSECQLAAGVHSESEGFAPRVCIPTPGVPGQVVARAAGDSTWLWASDWAGFIDADR